VALQDAVNALLAIAPKLTDHLEPHQLEAATSLLDRLSHPLSSDDILGLLSLLPPEGDTAHGLNWTILHAIEAAPAWPIWEALGDREHEWIDLLCVRLANARIAPPAS
jgi:hypothetical protein